MGSANAWKRYNVRSPLSAEPLTRMISVSLLFDLLPSLFLDASIWKMYIKRQISSNEIILQYSLQNGGHFSKC